MRRSKINLILIAGFVFFSTINPAEAYIDPGNGSYFIQMLIASALGGAYAVKLYWERITTYFSSIFNKKKNIENKEENESN